MYSAIILSGGSGTRMEKAIPKQFLILAGKPMIMHTLERLDQIEYVKEIVIVCHKNYIDLVDSYIKSYEIRTVCKIVEGGASRQESTYIGLKNSSYPYVIIHEAARPFVKKSEFESLINYPNLNAIYGKSIPFTVLKGTNQVVSLLNRKDLVNVQLPQKFQRNLLLEAHKKAAEEIQIFTEDASLLFYYTKENIMIIEGSIYNIKITDPIDMIIGEAIYKEYIIGRD